MSERRYTVVWTEVATQDLERLAARLLDERVLDKIISRGQSLEAVPGRGRTPTELRTVGDRAWLEIVESPWRIVYRIIGNIVEIHGVLDSRRSLDDILMERILNS